MKQVLSILGGVFHNQYLQFLLMVVGISAVAKIIELIVRSQNIKTIKDRKIMGIVEQSLTRNIIIIGFMIGVSVAVDLLKIEKNLAIKIKAVVNTIIMFMTYFILRNFITAITTALKSQKYRKRSKILQNKNISNIIYRVLEISLIFIMITLVMGIWGIKVGPLLTGLGIAGLAVGLALQDSLSNVFSGITLILDDAYTQEDYIELENGQKGVVYDIGYRSTKIRTFNDEILVLPNNVLAKMMIKNLSRPTLDYRLTLLFSVAYGSNVEQVKDVSLNAVKNIPGILDFPEASVCFVEMADFSLNFKLFATIQTPLEKINMTDRILTTLYTVFREENIEIPFPTSTVHLRQTKKENKWIKSEISSDEMV